MPLLRSALIPAPFLHGFTTREVGENAPLGPGLRLYRVKQVHGARVLVVGPGASPGDLREQEADALCAHTRGVAVGVVTADCVPLLLCAPSHQAWAAIHAGWRGTAARVVFATVEALGRLGALPGELVCAIGPSICGRCYEVGESVAAAIAAIDPAAVGRDAEGRLHADLRHANRSLLQEAGVRSQAIDDLDLCTACDPAARFHSYRRDRKLRGEQFAFIGLGS
jgi:polyphenol oxidase